MCKKKILLVTTLREFKNDIHHSTQLAFLNSIKNQTYQNYEVIITEFHEKELYKELIKLNINFKLIKSKFLSELKKFDQVYSHWEFADNAYPYLKKDENIIISTLSDCIFENNFFQTVVENYSPNFSGTSWPQVNYKNIQDYYDNKKYDIVRACAVKNELQYPLYNLMSDVYFFDGNIMLDEKYKNAWKKCKIHGIAQGLVQPLWFCFSNKKRINIYFKSKIHNIINYTALSSKQDRGEIINKTVWDKNDNLLENFCESLKINEKYWKTNQSFRKLFIFSSFSIKGSFFNIIFFKIIILKNFIIRFLKSIISKSKKLVRYV